MTEGEADGGSFGRLRTGGDRRYSRKVYATL